MILSLRLGKRKKEKKVGYLRFSMLFIVITNHPDTLITDSEATFVPQEGVHFFQLFS